MQPSRPLYTTVCLLALLLVISCTETQRTAPPTPLEQMLAETDSLARLSDSLQHHIAFDYVNLNRVAWQKPEQLLDRFGDLSGKTIVEIGAGTGFFTRRLARRAGNVLALDIDPGILLQLDSINHQRLPDSLYAKIQARLVAIDDPNLLPQEADAALVANTFMYIPRGVDYLQKLRDGLRPGSPILIIDFKKRSTPVGPPVEARRPADSVQLMLKQAGYTGVELDETDLDYQYIVRAVVPQKNN